MANMRTFYNCAASAARRNIQATHSKTNEFNNTATFKEIRSEDGAAPMPKVKITVPITPGNTDPVSSDDKPRIGIQMAPISGLEEKYKDQFAAAKFDGIIVGNVYEGSVAQKAGIQNYDYIYLLNGILVRSPTDIAQAMSTVKRGDAIKVHVQRIDYNANLSIDHIFTLHF